MKRIIEFDEELGREFDILQFSMSDVKSEAELFTKHASEIFNEILKALVIAINDKLPHVPCFAIEDAVLHAEHFEYQEKIDDCLQFFLESEQYEKCALIRELQKKLDIT